MSYIFSASMYFLSFLPLWISILFLDCISIWENNYNLYTEYISVVCIFGALIISIIVLIYALKSRRQTTIKQYILIDVTEEKTISVEFLLSYVLPLFAFDFTLWKQVILFLIFFVTMGFLCVRHNNFSINIILDAAHYFIYECTIENEDKKRRVTRVISKNELLLQKGEDILLNAINNEIMVDCS